MPALLAVILPLVLQYGPEVCRELIALAHELAPLFEDGNVPSTEQINDVFAKLDAAHARLQATR